MTCQALYYKFSICASQFSPQLLQRRQVKISSKIQSNQTFKPKPILSPLPTHQAHPPSRHILEKTEDLGVIGRLRFLSWWYSYLAYVIFKLLTYSHLFEGSLLVSQPRYQTVGSLDPNGHLIPVPNSLSFQTFALKCLMSQNIDFSVMYKRTRPASNCGNLSSLWWNSWTSSLEKGDYFSPVMSGLQAWLNLQGRLCKDGQQNLRGRMLVLMWLSVPGNHVWWEINTVPVAGTSSKGTFADGSELNVGSRFKRVRAVHCWHFHLANSSLWGCPMHCSTFTSIPGLCSEMPVVDTLLHLWQTACSQTFPNVPQGRAELPTAENDWTINSDVIWSGLA